MKKKINLLSTALMGMNLPLLLLLLLLLVLRKVAPANPRSGPTKKSRHRKRRRRDKRRREVVSVWLPTTQAAQPKTSPREGPAKCLTASCTRCSTPFASPRTSTVPASTTKQPSRRRQRRPPAMQRLGHRGGTRRRRPRRHRKVHWALMNTHPGALCRQRRRAVFTPLQAVPTTLRMEINTWRLLEAFTSLCGRPTSARGRCWSNTWRRTRNTAQPLTPATGVWQRRRRRRPRVTALLRWRSGAVWWGLSPTWWTRFAGSSPWSARC
mmetsp:Transcript_15636/g.32107  ORF Transcript_15636/g.32107 Transcript_15636/m.32107 type:complete len:267 (-) Transcript_15636:37-837(-)